MITTSYVDDFILLIVIVISYLLIQIANKVCLVLICEIWCLWGLFANKVCLVLVSEIWFLFLLGGALLFCDITRSAYQR